MARHSTLARIRPDRQLKWLAELRQKVERVGARCLDQGLGTEAVLLSGSRTRGDFDGHSDTDLIALGTTQDAAEAVADALADAHVGDDLIALSLEAWENKARSSHPTWRAFHAEAIPLLERPS